MKIGFTTILAEKSGFDAAKKVCLGWENRYFSKKFTFRWHFCPPQSIY